MCNVGSEMPYMENFRLVRDSPTGPTAPDTSVCANQEVFNDAVYHAVRHNRREEMKKARPWMYVYTVLWMVFFIWAIVLAMQVAPAGHERVEHLVFAMVFSPVYVLAYYVGAIGNNTAKAGFSMCGNSYKIA